MASYTPNYNLTKPGTGDKPRSFRSSYNSNLDIIDGALKYSGSVYCKIITFTNNTTGNIIPISMSLTGYRPYVRFMQGNNLCNYVKINISTDHMLIAEVNRISNGTITLAVGFAKCTGDDSSDPSSEGTYTFYSPAYTNQVLATSGGLGECSGGGSYSLFKLATLTVTSAYVNRPVVFEVSRRGYGFQKLMVIFNSENNVDPTLNTFATDGANLGFYIKKSATSTWDIYGSYNEPWGNCTVHRITGSAYNNGVTVTLSLTNADAQSGTTTVARYWGASYADSAGSVAWANVNSKGWTLAKSLSIAASASGGSMGNWIPSGYTPTEFLLMCKVTSETCYKASCIYPAISGNEMGICYPGSSSILCNVKWSSPRSVSTETEGVSVATTVDIYYR